MEMSGQLHRPASLTSPGKENPVGGPQSQSGRDSKQKISPLCACRKWNTITQPKT